MGQFTNLTRAIALGFLSTLGLTGCQFSQAYPLVLDNDGITVRLHSVRSEDSFFVDRIEVNTGGRDILRRVEVTVFNDKNGGLEVQDGEALKSWQAQSDSLQAHFAINAMLEPQAASAELLEHLHVFARIEGIVSEDNPDSNLVITESQSFP